MDNNQNTNEPKERKRLFAFNSKYTTIAAYVLIVAVILTLLIFLFLSFSDFSGYLKKFASAFRPLIYGAIIAYLVNPIMKLFDNSVFAFITADDKIPVPKTVPEIPQKPEKPVKPKPDGAVRGLSYAERLERRDKYLALLDDYKKACKKYREDLAEWKRAKWECKWIPKRAHALERRITRITYRHKRIEAKTSYDGEKKTRYGLRRALSVTCAGIVAAAMVALFVWMIIPQVVEGVNELVSRMPLYIATFSNWLSGLADEPGYFGEIINNLIESLNKLISTIYNVIQDILPYIRDALSGVVIVVKDLIIGIFFSVYLLLAKERLSAKLKKLTCAIFKPKAYDRIIDVCSDVNKNFGSFITAKLIDSLIIGILTFIGLLILNVPYYPLVAVIVGVTNIVPMFGPIIGAIPCAFIIFITNPEKVLVFIIFIIVLQQFDGNFLGPKLLGAQVNATSLGILTALTVLSSFWGITGLIIAVPLFAVVYKIIKEVSEKALEKKGASPNTVDYYNSDDSIGLGLHAEAEAKQKRKNDTLKKSFSSTVAGEAALNIPIVSSVVDKIDKSAESRKSE
ncbi:MAG: AI-2E family transporter [Clostridiales bacterium]|nr:AI-2E family transporter [Clostridiales bacterium]